jgi:hypothetical protein
LEVQHQQVPSEYQRVSAREESDLFLQELEEMEDEDLGIVTEQ